MTSGHAPSIELSPDAEDNGFAHMISQLLRQNLEDHPEKVRDFDRLRAKVALVVEDARVAITLAFSGGRLVVHDGIYGIPDLTIRADTDLIMQMSLMELVPRLGLPNLRGDNTRAILSASRDGRIRMYGALTNLPVVLRLTRVMSVT